MKFIDSAKFMARSLSNLVDNLAEGIHKIKYKDCDCFFECGINKDRSSKIDEKLKKKVKSTFKFSSNDINKYVLLLIKGVYLYEYIDEWEKFNETTLPEEEQFYSNLNMEDITDEDYILAKRVCKDFEIKDLGEYHDLYLKSDTLLLADVFKNFRKLCLKIHHLDLVIYLSAPQLAWQAALKKTEVKLELLTDIDMILMVEKGGRGICHVTNQYEMLVTNI